MRLPLGPILDGSGYGGERDFIFSQNFMLSETHIFGPTLTNEFRFGYNWNHSAYKQANAYDPTIASSLGLGGVPDLGPGQYGLPLGYFPQGGVQQWGSVGTNNETQNVYQILDNVTKILGNHSLEIRRVLPGGPLLVSVCSCVAGPVLLWRRFESRTGCVHGHSWRQQYRIRCRRFSCRSGELR